METRPARVNGPLDDVNDAFHGLYDAARADAQLDGPVFVLLADTLVVYQRGRRTALSFTPRMFHVIKSAAHGPIALYAALHRLVDQALDGPAQARLTVLRKHVNAALASLGETEGKESERDPEVLAVLRSVLLSTSAFLERTSNSSAVSARELEVFARETGTLLLRLVNHATRLQLSALHAHVTEALRHMDEQELRALQVVVTGDHQARIRSLAMQYFRRRLREPEGAEERVTYAEGVTDEREALAIVGTRRLDRAIAAAFFGDPKRLQRDLLGDSARDLLNSTNLPPLL